MQTQSATIRSESTRGRPLLRMSSWTRLVHTALTQMLIRMVRIPCPVKKTKIIVTAVIVGEQSQQLLLQKSKNYSLLKPQSTGMVVVFFLCICVLSMWTNVFRRNTRTVVQPAEDDHEIHLQPQGKSQYGRLPLSDEAPAQPVCTFLLKSLPLLLVN